MSDVIPWQRLVHKIEPCDFIGDSLLEKVNISLCNLESAFNRIHKVGDVKQSFCVEDHGGWKNINTERCVPKNLFPQLECLAEDGLICEHDDSYILPAVSPIPATCDGQEKTVNNFMFVGGALVVFEKPKLDPCCFGVTGVKCGGIEDDPLFLDCPLDCSLLE